MAIALAAASAASATAPNGYWELQGQSFPNGTSARDGGGSMSRQWRIEGRVLHSEMSYTELDGSILGEVGDQTSRYSAMSAWSEPPARIDAGTPFEIRCSVSARRTMGRKPWKFWLAAWLDGAGFTREKTQQTFEVEAAGGGGRKDTGAFRFRAPESPENRGRLFKLVINGATRGFGVATLPVEYTYRWVEAEPWIVDFVDANPKFWDGRTPDELGSEEIAASREIRKGSATDGISSLIMRIRQTGDRMVRVNIEEGGGKLALLAKARPWNAPDGTNWRFLLYTPREHFGGGPSQERPTAIFAPSAQPKQRLEDVLEVEELVLIGRNAKKDEKGKLVTIGPPQEIRALLARPPVVLIHGFKSEPIGAWVQAHETGQSFAAMLERAGMMPFLVNYQNSHGMPFDTRPSGFADNARVLWESPDRWKKFLVDQRWYKDGQEPSFWPSLPLMTPPILSDHQRVKKIRHGGIKRALEYYRENLELAATQADVIGHSMGGVLSRVYASQPNYRRPENFDQGDIHRLITICSPHFGSELPEVKDALHGGVIGEEPWAAWARRTLTSGFLAWLLEPEPGTMRDLRAESAARPPKGHDRSAMASIGATPIPSFAIVTSIDTNQLGLHPYDSGPEFRYLYTVLGFVFFNNRPLLDAFITDRAQQWRRAGPLQRTTDRTSRPPGKEGELGLPGHVLDWGDESKYPVYTGLASRALDRAAYYWQMRREGEVREKMRTRVEETSPLAFGLLDGGIDWYQTPDDIQRQILWKAASEVASSAASSAATRASQAALGGDLTKLQNAATEQDIPIEVIGFLRDLIFHGDNLNDGAVRTVSQIGGLDDAYVHYTGISHLMATWHYKVIRKSVDLLKWEDEKFSRKGFPAAAQRMPHWLPSVGFLDDRVYGALAVDWSGMVRSHAVAYGEVSDREDVVVIARPVNHDSTPLIESGAATKGMPVKGKSSNWGPHAGFIARDQKFSKIWRVYESDVATRDEQIAKYSAITEKMLKEGKYPASGPEKRLVGRSFAVPRPLVVPIDKPVYEVMFDPQQPDAEKALYLRHQKSQKIFSPWNAEEEIGGKTKPRYDPALKPKPARDGKKVSARLVPLEVMADGLADGQPKPYLTADYDLLAIGFKRPKMGAKTPPEVASAEFDPLLGAISKRQIEIVEKLNQQVAKTGYRAGNVTHHGPENQYGGSPYVDYPLLVFDPGVPKDGKAEIFLIRQGPVGFRDIHLKRYFTEKVREGYNLYPNPSSEAGWLWEAHRPFSKERGFDPQDAGRLPEYVAELPRPRKRNTARPPRELAPTFDHGPVAELPDFARFTAAKEADPQEVTNFIDTVTLAKAGDSQAMGRIGYYFANTPGKAKDVRKGLLWYEASARAGNSSAMVNLANRYLSGRDVDKSETRALQLFRQASDAGSGVGANAVGWIHQKGLGVPADVDEALKWYRLAEQRESEWAYLNLGRLYRDGHGVKPDPKRAAQYFEKAAAKELVEAKYALGRMYSRGEGVEKNPKLGAKWLLQAAEGGFGDAMIDLSNAYLEGDGVRRNPKQAIRWLDEAAKQNVGMAHNNLGALYLEGVKGVKANPMRAIPHLHKGAELGVALAQYNLGRAYLGGIGVRRDPARAEHWFTAAADQGHEGAREQLARMRAEARR